MIFSLNDAMSFSNLYAAHSWQLPRIYALFGYGTFPLACKALKFLWHLFPLILHARVSRLSWAAFYLSDSSLVCSLTAFLGRYAMGLRTLGYRTCGRQTTLPVYPPDVVTSKKADGLYRFCRELYRPRSRFVSPLSISSKHLHLLICRFLYKKGQVLLWYTEETYRTTFRFVILRSGINRRGGLFVYPIITQNGGIL